MASAFNVTRIPAKLLIVGDGVLWAANCDQANFAKTETVGTSAKFILAEGVVPPAPEGHLPTYGPAVSNEDSAAHGVLSGGSDPLGPLGEPGKIRKRYNVP